MPVLGSRRLRRVARDERLSVVDHLDELRNRLIVSIGALIVAFAVAYGFHDQLVHLLERPLPQKYRDQGLITLSPTEPFFTTLKVCFWAAILVALPVWLYQLYAFVIPAVQDQPRRRMLAVVAGASALFAGGVAFGFFIVLPVALNFLLNFGGDAFQTQVRAGEYFGFATTLMLVSGLMF
jgi:sec-independent protein translocase protein TatC